MAGESETQVHRELRNVVADPARAEGYGPLARAFSGLGDFEAGTRALLHSLVISKPALEAVRITLDRVMHYPNPRAMSLLWRMAEEASSYPHEELLEREIAARRTVRESERRNYLSYLFRRADYPRDALPYLVCGMPKSASTFVSGLVAEMTGLPIDDPHNYNEFFQGALDKGCIWDLCQKDIVVHGHLAATPRTVCYLKLLKARPIITVRNVFDAIRSYVDHMFPTVRDDPELLPSLLDHAILRVGAFYVEFYASWRRASDQFDMLWVHYDEIHRDPGGLVERIAAHIGKGAITPRGLEKAHALIGPGGMDERRKHALMFNKGVSGRGREIGDRHRSMLRSMYPFYADVDFRPIDPEFDPAP